MRLVSAGDPFMWKISQPAKNGPATSHFLRDLSEVRVKAPFLVPTRTRTPAMMGLLDLRDAKVPATRKRCNGCIGKRAEYAPDYCACGTRTIQTTPKRSSTMPKAGVKKDRPM